MINTPFMSIYDTKKENWIYFDPASSDHFNYFLDKTLKCGLKIRIRSDAYYLFNFLKSPLGESISQEEWVAGKGLIIQNERLEVLHAFLACLRSETHRITKIYHGFDMNFMDNFIIPTDDNFEKILRNDDSNLFSSCDYKELCQIRKDKLTEPNKEINEGKIYENTINILDKLIEHDNKAPYVLGILYRAAVYHNLGLEIQSATFIRSVFEWLAKYHFPNKENPYKPLLKKFKASCNEEYYIKELRKLRNSALHELKFPRAEDRSILLERKSVSSPNSRVNGSDDKNLPPKTNALESGNSDLPGDMEKIRKSYLNNPISKSFRLVERIFNKTFNVEVSIPLKQSISSSFVCVEKGI